MECNSGGSAVSAARFPAQSRRFLTASPHSSRRNGSSPCLRITTTATDTSRFGFLPLLARRPRLIEEAPDPSFRPPYVGGGGWVGVELSSVDDEQLGAVIREAFRLMTVKAIA